MNPTGGELVLVHGRSPDDLGGGPSYVLAAALAARDLGLHPHVFSIGRHNEVRETDYGTLHLVAAPVGDSPHTTLPLLAPRLRRAVLGFLRDRPGHHVVHGFSFWADLSPRQQRRWRTQGVHVDLVTTVWTVVEDESPAKLRSEIMRASRRRRARGRAALWWDLLVTRRVERRVSRSSRLILVNYESVRAMLEQAHGPGLPIRRTTYLAATAFDDDPEGETPTPPGVTDLAAPGVPLIVAMSRHDGRKGLDVLIRALGLLRDREIPFAAVIGGSGSLLEAHRLLVTSLGLSDRVRLPGRVPAVMPYLRAADIFVLPSVSESSGSVSVLEALQAGVAVVASRVDGIPEDLTDGQDSLLVPPAHPVALSDAIERLLTDPDLRGRIAAAGRGLFERRFSRAVAVAGLGKIYAELGLIEPTTAAATRRTSSSVNEGPDGR